MDAPSARLQIGSAHQAASRYDLVLLDAQMPGMDGLQLARASADPALASLRLVMLSPRVSRHRRRRVS